MTELRFPVRTPPRHKVDEGPATTARASELNAWLCDGHRLPFLTLRAPCFAGMSSPTPPDDSRSGSPGSSSPEEIGTGPCHRSVGPQIRHGELPHAHGRADRPRGQTAAVPAGERRGCSLAGWKKPARPGPHTRRYSAFVRSRRALRDCRPRRRQQRTKRIACDQRLPPQPNPL